jgi:hypothetical protein
MSSHPVEKNPALAKLSADTVNLFGHHEINDEILLANEQ